MIGTSEPAPHRARRRFVTGLRNGTPRFVVDEEFPGDPVSADDRHRRGVVWGADQVLTVPSDGSVPPRAEYFPAPPGWRVVIADVPPGLGAAAAEAEEAGLSSGDEALESIGALHATATVDVTIVLSGELVVTLAAGEERTMRAGDSLVQNGLPHRWANRSNSIATIATVVIGAEPSQEGRQ